MCETSVSHHTLAAKPEHTLLYEVVEKGSIFGRGTSKLRFCRGSNEKDLFLTNINLNKNTSLI